MRQAVLVMAYGTPARIEDVEAYYTHIRRGNPPPPSLLAELVQRYEAVGGPTALNRITREQAAALEELLAVAPWSGSGRAADGAAIPVYVGFKHVAPFIADAVERMAADGVERAVGLVLAPQYSNRSIAEYIAHAEARRPADLKLDVIPTWHDHQGFVQFLASRLSAAMGRIEDGSTATYVLFTAHSIPVSTVALGDPYPEELRRTCELVAARAKVDRWTFAYQSAGRTAEPWLGPDVLETIEELAASGAAAVVVQAIGFVADNLEVLYDLDIEARRAAESRRLTYVRAEMPNTHPDFIAELADLVGSRLEAGLRAATCRRVD